MKLTLLFFELSYFVRFLWDIYILAAISDPYTIWLVYDLVLYLDVLPYICLLLFHSRNFRQTAAGATVAIGRANNSNSNTANATPGEQSMAEEN